MEVGRYAPSTTGRAHPGTLMAGLLCWLDARSRGARLVLRLEDLDPDRCLPEYRAAMIDDLRWIGLDWDTEAVQSESAESHEHALDRLATAGHLYPCCCSRAEIRRGGVPAPDGGFRYANTCRGTALPPRTAGGWRATQLPLRARLPHAVVSVRDEGGADLSQDPGAVFGDPVVWRRDGAISYHLASVVDDADSGVTRIVRGRDLAASTATQVALRRLLGLPTPTYRHHLLLLETRGGKLAKLHGSVSTADLRPRYTAPELVGVLAHAAGLIDSPDPVTPRDLLPTFTWSKVATTDKILTWTNETLHLSP